MSQHPTVELYMKKEGFEYAYGSILGAFVGDAAGAPLEFASSIDKDTIKGGMTMQGGGLLDIGAGQITDDSELAMCQIQVLSIYPPRNIKTIPHLLLEKYREWYHTAPFDIGNTTINAVGRSQELNIDDHIERVKKENSGSKANGALMRITPLAVWSRNLSDENKHYIISQDTKLTHPNKSCIESSIAYSLAIHSLLTHPGDNERALEKVDAYLNTLDDSEVVAWIREDSQKKLGNIDVSMSIGFVRWALTLAFYHLRNKTPYEQAIRNTIAKGGDTDTNAAIVGGMIGALHGESAIPEYMKDPVLNYTYDPDSGIGFERPHFLSPHNLPNLVEKLYTISG